MGKTYQEIMSMPKAFILWHVYNMEKSYQTAMEEKIEDINLNILLQNPELYQAMHKAKESEIENSFFEETVNEEGIVMSTMGAEEFKNLIKQREELTKEQVIISKVIEGQEVFNIASDLAPDNNPLIVERY